MSNLEAASIEHCRPYPAGSGIKVYPLKPQEMHCSKEDQEEITRTPSSHSACLHDIITDAAQSVLAP